MFELNEFGEFSTLKKLVNYCGETKGKKQKNNKKWTILANVI